MQKIPVRFAERLQQLQHDDKRQVVLGAGLAELLGKQGQFVLPVLDQLFCHSVKNFVEIDLVLDVQFNDVLRVRGKQLEPFA